MARHIDVGELKEWVENWLYKDRYYHNGRVCKNIPTAELYDILEQMPSADVRENVHAHWIGIDDFPHETFECDHCGRIEEVQDVRFLPNFCPNCGAEMEVRK